MVHVLEHLPDPGVVLQEVRRILDSSGGAFFVEVPNANSLRARLALSLFRPLWTAHAERYNAFPIHLQYFNATALRHLLEAHRFRILAIGTLGLGVEELFASPTRPVGTASSSDCTHSPPSQRGSPRRMQRTRTAVKRVFSTFRLGENLYAVCRPEPDARVPGDRE
jgi:SAM-dependent methyltransferase